MSTNTQECCDKCEEFHLCYPTMVCGCPCHQRAEKGEVYDIMDRCRLCHQPSPSLRNNSKQYFTPTTNTSDWQKPSFLQHTFKVDYVNAVALIAFIAKKIEAALVQGGKIGFEAGREEQTRFMEQVIDKGNLKSFEAGHTAGFKEGRAQYTGFAREAAFAEVKRLIEKLEFRMNVDDYLPMVEVWNGTDYDKPFDDGYKQAKVDLLTKLTDTK